MNEPTLAEAYGHWSTFELALKGRYKEVLLLQEAIDKSNVALEEAVAWKHLMTVQLSTSERERASLKLQVRAMQEIVDAAMNENMPRIRAATKVYQDRQRALKRIDERRPCCGLPSDHSGPCR